MAATDESDEYASIGSGVSCKRTDLGIIEPAPAGSDLWWVFTPRGRKLMRYLGTNSLPIEQRDPGTDAGAVE